jgi:hypothetical protein
LLSDAGMLVCELNESCKGSFGSHHLGLESKNSFMILTITYLAATELVMEFIWNSMGFHLMPNLNTYWVSCHFYRFSKWNDIIMLFHFISTKWNEMVGAKRALIEWWVLVPAILLDMIQSSVENMCWSAMKMIFFNWSYISLIKSVVGSEKSQVFFVVETLCKPCVPNTVV